MKSFWWFKENSIAGMGRPGFNSIRWTELPFDEAVLLGWIGLYSSGSVSLNAFRSHLQTYVPKIYKFHKLGERSGQQAIEIFATNDGVGKILERLKRRTDILENFTVVDNSIHFNLSEPCLKSEIDFLKKRNIRHLVSLTEKQHSKDVLHEHFTIHHIGIKDLGAPHIDQARQLAEIIKFAQMNQERVVVHCLAGIGRTSTMLMAAHILLGEDAHALELLLAKQNPSFGFTGSQAEFVRSLSIS